jgi:cell wall assembly regulator SMI1
MNRTTLNRLEEFFARAPFMKAGGVDVRTIQAAEEELRVAFVDDYRQFLSRYGGALVGPYPVYGLARADPMDVRLWSVVGVTEHFRKQAWPGADSSYVISMDHAGNPICIDGTGKVVSFDHDAGEMVDVARDFDSYLQHCLSGL